MIFKINTITLIAILSGVVIVIFFIKRSNQTAYTDNKRMVDSLTNIVKYKDSVYVRTLISKNDSIATIHFRSDSLSSIIAKKDKALDVSKAQVAVLVAKSYLIPSDSTKQRLENCDSIKKEAIYLAENVSDYQRAQETLTENNRQLLATMQRTGELKDSVYAELKGEFNFLAGKFSKLDYNYQRMEKKANKRVTAGIQAGVTYINGKPQPYAGIGVQYTIIRLF